MITSVGNSHIRAVSQLLRKRSEREAQGVFVIEGLRSVREAPPGSLRELYVTDALLAKCPPEDRRWIEAAPCPRERVSEEVMQKLSDTQHPQGVLAVVQMRRVSPEELFPAGRAPLLLLLENLQDPGNLGTIFRAGEGAGVTGLLLAGATADPYNPKVVRSTMGSIFRVPFLRLSDVAKAGQLLRERGVRVYAADSRAERDYDACDYRGGTAFAIGNEGAGLTAEARRLAEVGIRIPMCGRLESLNAGVSASLLAFEAARQRRAGLPGA